MLRTLSTKMIAYCMCRIHKDPLQEMSVDLQHSRSTARLHLSTQPFLLVHQWSAAKPKHTTNIVCRWHRNTSESPDIEMVTSCTQYHLNNSTRVYIHTNSSWQKSKLQSGTLGWHYTNDYNSTNTSLQNFLVYTCSFQKDFNLALLTTYVRTILLYGVPVWNFAAISKILRLQVVEMWILRTVSKNSETNQKLKPI